MQGQQIPVDVNLNSIGMMLQTQNQAQQGSINANNVQPNPQTNSFEDTVIYYQHEACRLYIANVVLTNQVKELLNDKNELLQKISKLEKRHQESLIFTEEKKKRQRRAAQEIERHYKCPCENCQKSYGSEGSLAQHIKLKHPEFYSTISSNLSQALSKQITNVPAGTNPNDNDDDDNESNSMNNKSSEDSQIVNEQQEDQQKQQSKEQQQQQQNQQQEEQEEVQQQKENIQNNNENNQNSQQMQEKNQEIQNQIAQEDQIQQQNQQQEQTKEEQEGDKIQEDVPQLQNNIQEEKTENNN